MWYEGKETSSPPHDQPRRAPLRGDDPKQHSMYSFVSLEQRVPADHPLRPIRRMVDRGLASLNADFEKLYANQGRPSIPPERLLRALLLQVFFTIRSERMLIEQLDYNLLFRWFVGMSADEPVWNASTFSKNRERLLAGDIARRFFSEVLEEARKHHLLSDEHFTVDGTLIEAWASHKSFRPKDDQTNPPTGRNAEVDFRGEKRRNDTHASTTDPDARLFRKGNTGAVLCYMGHVLMENRHGLVIDGQISHATGKAERESALAMVARLPGSSPVTVGADKGYDSVEFVAGLRQIGATPHVAQNLSGRSSAVDDRTTRHEGYGISQRKRKLVEEVFGWTKTVGGLRKTRHRGQERVDWVYLFTLAAYNLIRMPKLIGATG
jgi:transposase